MKSNSEASRVGIGIVVFDFGEASGVGEAGSDGDGGRIEVKGGGESRSGGRWSEGTR